MPFERDLSCRKLSRCRGLLKHKTVDTLQNVAHPIVEIEIGELAHLEVQEPLGVVSLQMGDSKLLLGDTHLIRLDSDLLVSDSLILRGERHAKLPVFARAFAASRS